MLCYASVRTPDLHLERSRLSQLRRDWSHIYAETDRLSSEARHGVEATGADIRLRMEAIDAELSRRPVAITDIHDVPSAMAS
jgi:hypothetical protein